LTHDAQPEISDVLRHLYTGKAKPSRDRFKPALNVRSSFPKPKAGGLWTSPPGANGGSAWTDWCLSEEYQDPPFPFYELIPEPDAQMYVIDSYADLVALMAQYGRQPYEDVKPGDALYDVRVFDWEKMAQDVDALHLTEAGQWATRFTHPLDLYGWDCASTLWFGWKFSDVIDLGLWSPEEVCAI
jgi:hypothetical protein